MSPYIHILTEKAGFRGMESTEPFEKGGQLNRR